MFILCIILPPIAAAISGGFSSFFINLILTCFGWLPGIVHAIMVTNKSIVEEQNEELISTLEKNNISVPQKEKSVFGGIWKYYFKYALTRYQPTFFYIY